MIPGPAASAQSPSVPERELQVRTRRKCHSPEGDAHIGRLFPSEYCCPHHPRQLLGPGI
jgi:hypothetical protein